MIAHFADAREDGVGEVFDVDGVAFGDWRGGDAGPLQAHGEDVGGGCHGADFCLWAVDARVADEERDTDGFFVGQAALAAEAVFAVEVAVVAGEDDGGVGEMAGAFESVDEAAEAFVDGLGHTHAVEDHDVVGGGLRGERRDAFDVLQEGGFICWEDFVVAAAGRSAAGVEVPMARGDFEIVGLFEAGDFAVGVLGDVGMDGFVGEVEAEGFVALLIDEIDGVIGKNIGDVALGLDGFSVDVEGRIEGFALAGEGDPVIEAGAGRVIDTHVPFTEEGGGVAVVVEEAGPGFERVAVAGAVGVIGDSVLERILTGEERRATGGAEGCGDEGVFEAGAFAGEAVGMRGLGEGMAGAAEFIEAEIVDEDEDDVGPGRCGGGKREAQELSAQHELHCTSL